MTYRINGPFSWHALSITLLLLIYTGYACATTNPGDRELQRQQERQLEIEKQLQPVVPDARLIPQSVSGELSDSHDSVCFEIKDIHLQGGAELPLREEAKALLAGALNQCMGLKAIQRLMTDLQNMWIADGLVTTRVLAPPQDLSSGQLRLTVVPGVLRQIVNSQNAPINLATTIPAKPLILLDLRDFEQGLENLQRLPTVEASFKILPGNKPGESDVFVDWQQSKRWRVAVSANDSGSESTGRNQANATIYFDNLLGFSDLMYLSRGTDLHSKNSLGSDSYTAHFSVPIGYWNIGFTSSGYDYLQTVAGLGQNIEYSGSTQSQAVDISRVVQRSNRSKTSVEFTLGKRQSRNYIEDVEVEIQRRRTAFWELGVKNRYFLDSGTLDSELAYRKGTRWFGATPAPEEASGDATALSDILKFNVAIQMPFQVSDLNFRWRSRFNGQWSDTHLTPQDQFSIGSRYSVRGFDGQVSLSADRGWYLQNEIAWQLPDWRAELYWGLDHGEVSGNGSEQLRGTHLTGTVVGLNGNWQGLSYQIFAGKPLSQPQGFQADDYTLGFSVNWEY